MKYLVVECHPAYAVVTDENGRFIKTANLHYNVGDIVENVIELRIEQKKKRNFAWVYAAVAACLLLVMLPTLILPNVMYASVYMKINPEVRIDVNRKDVVVGLEGVNDDGIELIKGYTFKNKDIDTVVDELVVRAIDMEYLKEGGTVAISLEGDSDDWVNTTGGKIDEKLSIEGAHKMSFNVEVKNKKNNQHVPRHNRDDVDDYDSDDDDEIEDDDNDLYVDDDERDDYEDDRDELDDFDESSRTEPPIGSDRPRDPNDPHGPEYPQAPPSPNGNEGPNGQENVLGNGLGKPNGKECINPDCIDEDCDGCEDFDECLNPTCNDDDCNGCDDFDKCRNPNCSDDDCDGCDGFKKCHNPNCLDPECNGCEAFGEEEPSPNEQMPPQNEQETQLPFQPQPPFHIQPCTDEDFVNN